MQILARRQQKLVGYCKGRRGGRETPLCNARLVSLFWNDLDRITFSCSSVKLQSKLEVKSSSRFSRGGRGDLGVLRLCALRRPSSTHALPRLDCQMRINSAKGPVLGLTGGLGCGCGEEEEGAQAAGGQAMWLCPAEAHSFSPETLGSGAPGAG